MMNRFGSVQRWYGLGTLLLVGVVCGVFGRVVGFEFLNYDDPVYVTDNPRVLHGITWENVVYAFKPSIGLWHPLTWLSYMLDGELFGENPRGFHLTNLVMHLCTTVLLFHVIRLVTGDIGKSFGMALLFAVHPLNVETVAWISSRKDLICTFFGLATIGAYVKFVRRRHYMWYGLSVLFFICSVMGKAMAMTLPVVLILVDVLPLKRIQSENYYFLGKRLVLEKLPFFIISFFVMGMAVYASKTGGSLRTTEEIDVLARLSHVPVNYVKYMWFTFFPFQLSPHYPLVTEPYSWLLVAVSLVLLIGITLLVVWSKGFGPEVSFGWLWFLITLFPVSGLVRVGGQSLAARYMYLPLIGLLIFVIWVASRFVVERVGVIPVRKWLLVGVCGVLGVVSARDVQNWQSTERVFRRTIQIVPNDDLAHATLGGVLFEQGRYDEARKHILIALQLNPNLPNAYVNLGQLLHDEKDYIRAEEAYRKAIALEPDNYVARTNLGVVLAEMGRIEEAIREYETALEHNPNYAKAWNNLGNVHVIQRDYQKAAECYERALELNEKDPAVLSNLGAVYLITGEPTKALEFFQRSLELDPQDEETLLNAAVAALALGNYELARVFAEQAIEVAPNFDQARQFLEAHKLRLFPNQQESMP